MDSQVLYIDLRTGLVTIDEPDLTGASLQEITLRAPLPGLFLVRQLNTLLTSDTPGQAALPVVIKGTIEQD